MAAVAKTTATKALVVSVFNVLLTSITTISTALASNGNLRDSIISGSAALAVGLGSSLLTYYVPNVAKQVDTEAKAETYVSAVSDSVAAVQKYLVENYGPEYRARAATALEAASEPAPAQTAAQTAAPADPAPVLPGAK